MKQLILTLSLILELTHPAFSSDAGDSYADPFKVMTQGQLIGQDSYGINGDIDTYLIIALKFLKGALAKIWSTTKGLMRVLAARFFYP